ncbi:hypothetical protein CKK33_16910 [Mucilaginibacter sp. MD40]|uniref:hypothetical protein n=1 Tax=Mucilaginibacter sp. MD40 TaxID=2029590 RepID=UPI000BAC52AD|nr:hypothetical protein [Mucilaginibacter sp. MD40]PAW95083.1 hypothetical protein CKK33_16910 [Mucilaginibacter sp. MD40]
MANTCFNEVSFGGNPAAAMKAYQFFYDIAVVGNTDLPGFRGIDRPVAWDVSLEDGQLFRYRSVGKANTDRISAYAAHFGADHRHYYIEPIAGLCGEMSSQNGNTTHIKLVEDDFGLILYDPLSEQFYFRDEFADREHELWPVLLREKKLLATGNEVERRLKGELPRIDLAGKDFFVDWQQKELRQADDERNRIPADKLMLTKEGDGYICFYEPQTGKVVKPRDLSDLPETICLLELPNEFELDPIALARENGLDDTDLLLAYPYKAHRTAIVTELSELIERQKANGRSR